MASLGEGRCCPQIRLTGDIDVSFGLEALTANSRATVGAQQLEQAGRVRARMAIRQVKGRVGIVRIKLAFHPSRAFQQKEPSESAVMQVKARVVDDAALDLVLGPVRMIFFGVLGYDIPESLIDLRLLRLGRSNRIIAAEISADGLIKPGQIRIGLILRPAGQIARRLALEFGVIRMVLNSVTVVAENRRRIAAFCLWPEFLALCRCRSGR